MSLSVPLVDYMNYTDGESEIDDNFNYNEFSEIEANIPHISAAVFADSSTPKPIQITAPVFNSLAHLANRKLDGLVRCDQCDIGAAKYRCPECSKVACSLICVKAHKITSSDNIRACSGQRVKTDFVALSTFNDKQLLDDYAYLHDLSRFVDASKRDMRFLCGSSLSSFSGSDIGEMSHSRHQTMHRIKKAMMYQVQRNHFSQQQAAVLANDDKTNVDVNINTMCNTLSVSYNPLSTEMLTRIDGLVTRQLMDQNMLEKTQVALQRQCLYRGLLLEFMPLGFKKRAQNSTCLKPGINESSTWCEAFCGYFSIDCSSTFVAHLVKLRDEAVVEKSEKSRTQRNIKSGAVASLTKFPKIHSSIAVNDFPSAIASVMIRHQLAPYLSIERLDMLSLRMEVLGCPANARRFRKFKWTDTVRQSLKGWCVVEFPILYVLHPYEILSEETSSPVPRFVCLSDDEWMQRYTETNLAVEALVGSGKPIKSTKTPVLASDRSAKVVDALSTLISAPASDVSTSLTVADPALVSITHPSRMIMPNQLYLHQQQNGQWSHAHQLNAYNACTDDRSRNVPVAVDFQRHNDIDRNVKSFRSSKYVSDQGSFDRHDEMKLMCVSQQVSNPLSVAPGGSYAQFLPRVTLSTSIQNDYATGGFRGNGNRGRGWRGGRGCVRGNGRGGFRGLSNSIPEQSANNDQQETPCNILQLSTFSTPSDAAAAALENIFK